MSDCRKIIVFTVLCVLILMAVATALYCLYGQSVSRDALFVAFAVATVAIAALATVGTCVVARDLRAASEQAAQVNLELSKAGAKLKQTNVELERLNEELHRSNKDLDDFAYIASHDLREPLRGISSYASFIVQDYEDKLDEQGRENLDSLQRLCKRMENLIQTLLQFSRLGRAELAVTQVDLNELMAEVTDMMHVTLEEQNVEVRIAELLPTVKCDGIRVRELLHNLIVNAVKYNDNSEKWVEIGVENNTADQSTPVFYVSDNGIGIKERHLESVFDLFRRLHARDKYGGGTGAGLTFVKQIVERHGGRIWVESTLGEGSKFLFTLGQP